MIWRSGRTRRTDAGAHQTSGLAFAYDAACGPDPALCHGTWKGSGSTTTTTAGIRAAAPSWTTCARRKNRRWITWTADPVRRAVRWRLMKRRAAVWTTRTIRTGSREGSLLAVLDRSVTPMGRAAGRLAGQSADRSEAINGQLTRSKN